MNAFLMRASGANLFVIGLLLVLNAAVSTPADAVSHDEWLDAQSGLTWRTIDNGFGVSWEQAKRYCDGLPSKSKAHWQLPTIEELQSLFDAKVDHDGRHIRGPIRLTGWQWSATPGEQPGEGWVFDYGDGGRASVAAGDSGLNRALCVSKR